MIQMRTSHKKLAQVEIFLNIVIVITSAANYQPFSIKLELTTTTNMIEMRISPEKDQFFMIGGQPNVILSYNESIMICYNETQFAYRNSIELQIS